MATQAEFTTQLIEQQKQQIALLMTRVEVLQAENKELRKNLRRADTNSGASASSSSAGTKRSADNAFDEKKDSDNKQPRVRHCRNCGDEIKSKCARPDCVRINAERKAQVSV